MNNPALPCKKRCPAHLEVNLMDIILLLPKRLLLAGQIIEVTNKYVAFLQSRQAAVSHEAKKKQHAHMSSGQCNHYSELFTQMAALKF